MKIISLSPAITEILFALNASDQIVGNTYWCDFPAEAKNIPKVGSFTNLDLKKLKIINPDLILTSTIVQHHIFNQLKKEGFNVIHTDPRSLKDILESIKLIGKLVKKNSAARKIREKMEQEISDLRKNKASHNFRVYIEEWYDPVMFSGNWVPEIVELAGGKYFPYKKQGISQQTNESKLLKFDPEYIFVSYCGFGIKSDVNKIYRRETWQNITAVKNKMVFAINETILNRPGPRIVQSSKEIRSYLNIT